MGLEREHREAEREETDEQPVDVGQAPRAGEQRAKHRHEQEEQQARADEARGGHDERRPGEIADQPALHGVREQVEVELHQQGQRQGGRDERGHQHRDGDERAADHAG